MPYLPMPLPLPYDESKGFWAGCKRHELLIEKCKDCHTFRHPPIPVCPECQSWNKEWVKVSGYGKVEGFTIVTRALLPGLPVPYNVVRVELDEQKGLLMIGNVIDCFPQEINVGMPVRVCFEDINPGRKIFYFKKMR